MKAQDEWSRVDAYFAGLLFPPDYALDAALKDSAAAGLPPIQVSQAQGKFLHLLSAGCGARRVLEVGTLGGYSTIWLARAVQAAAGSSGGRVVTLEFNPRHAEVARANLARAGFAEMVDIRLGPALETLAQIAEETASGGELAGGFDFIFIDADKVNTAAYFAWAVRLSHPGTVIVVDNVVRKGAVTDAETADQDVCGIRRFLAALANEPRVSATALQTVGVKGYDGFVMAVVLPEKA